MGYVFASIISVLVPVLFIAGIGLYAWRSSGKPETPEAQSQTGRDPLRTVWRVFLVISIPIAAVAMYFHFSLGVAATLSSSQPLAALADPFAIALILILVLGVASKITKSQRWQTFFRIFLKILLTIFLIFSLLLGAVFFSFYMLFSNPSY